VLVAARLGALGERDFRLLWLGQATSAFGSGLVPVALAFAVVDLTASASALGVVLAAGLVARVVFLLVGGAVADRLPRQRVMLVADLLRTVTQGTVAVLLLSGHAHVWHLVVLFALFGAADAFFSPASTGLVPQAVSASRLQQANALMSLSRSLSWVAGPALAGLIVAGPGPGWAFAADAATFLVSSVSLALLRLSPGIGRVARRSVPAEIRRGWLEVRRRPWVWVTIARFSVTNLAIAPVFVLGPFVAQDDLGGATAWGLIATCSGIGAILGDAAALRFRPRRPLVAGGLAVSLWALEPAFLARPFPTAAIAVVAAAGYAGMSFSNALWFTTLQQRIPRVSLSRVSSFDWLGSLVFQQAGYIVAGPLAAAIGTTTTLLASAALQASASIGGALAPPVRRLRAPDHTDLPPAEISRRALS
jgi:MFS family permease